jgi:hypothetical protein
MIMGVGALVVNIIGVGSTVGDCAGAGPQATSKHAMVNTPMPNNVMLGFTDIVSLKFLMLKAPYRQGDK